MIKCEYHPKVQRACFKVGDFIQAMGFDHRFLEGTIDAVEWSDTFDTAVYRFVDYRLKRHMWVYEDDVYSHNHSKRPPATPPRPIVPPDPVMIWE